MPAEFPRRFESQEFTKYTRAHDKDIFDRAIPPALQDAIYLTCTNIRDIVKNEAIPPVGMKVIPPETHELDCSDQNLGVTRAYFRLERVHEGETKSNLPHTELLIGLSHDAVDPNRIQLLTHAKITHTEIYDLAKHAIEKSTIILTPPVHLEGEAVPTFDMSLVNASEEERMTFRRTLAKDIKEGYDYMIDDKEWIDKRRKVRAYGTPRKSAA